MSTRQLGLPSALKRRLEAALPRYRGTQVTVRVTPRDQHERKCAAWAAEQFTRCRPNTQLVSADSRRVLEEALQGVPGVYATTQVCPASDSVTAPNVFSSPAGRPGSAPSGTTATALRPQVLALIRGEEP